MRSNQQTRAIAGRVVALARGGRRPELTIDDHRLLRVAGTVQFFAGALVVAVVLLLPDADRGDHGAYTSLALLGAFAAVARWSVSRPSDAIARLAAFGGVLFIATIVAVGRPVGPTPFLMLWPMLTTAYFFGRRELLAASLLMLCSLAGALVINPTVGDDFLLQLVPTTLVVAIASTLLVMLRERVDGLICDLERTASTDGLTGLSNRSSWHAALSREIERARRTGESLSIAIFDLDRFKAINDCFGHAEGDTVLVRFAELLGEECRSFDTPGRVGGEEFALLLVGADATGARTFVERLRHRLAQTTTDEMTPFTASSGVAQLDVHGYDITSLMLAADRALYRAKAAGRDRCVIADGPTVTAADLEADQSGEQLSESVTLKLEPQPQAATTFGFSTLKPAPVSASTKSITEPST